MSERQIVGHFTFMVPRDDIAYAAPDKRLPQPHSPAVDTLTVEVWNDFTFRNPQSGVVMDSGYFHRVGPRAAAFILSGGRVGAP